MLYPGRNREMEEKSARGYQGVFEAIKNNLNFKEHDAHTKKMAILWVVYIILAIVCVAIPADTIYASPLTLLPIGVMFVYVVVSRDFIQGFVFGTLLAYLSYYKLSGAGAFVDDITATLADEDTMFTIMTFFICGGTIAALTDSGAAKSFGKWVASKVKSQKLSLIVTWLLTLGLSIDDYIDPLTVGTAMTPITDAQRIPREAPTFIGRSSSSAPGLFYPMGDWAYFIIMQMVALGLVNGEVSDAVKEYMKFVPYLFYPMLAMLLGLLFALGVVPKIGKMKDAYERVANGGPTVLGQLSEEDEEEIRAYEDKKDLNPINFFLPVAVLFASMLVTDFDGVRAGAIALSATGIIFIAQGIYSINEYVEVMITGFKDMLDLVILLVFGYMIGGVMEEMGFAQFITGVAGHVTIPALFPAIIFILFCCTEYLCTLNWTLFIIAMPILYQVAPAIGANLQLTIAAMISAGLFGSNTCPFSDGGIVVSKGFRMNLYDHGFSSMPYFIITAVLSAIAYVIAGFVLA